MVVSPFPSFQIEYQGFKTEWTVAAGADSVRTILIPVYNSGGTFDAIIDWGDGSTSHYTGTTADRTHIYANAGTYIVEITGEYPGFTFYETTNISKLTDVIYWGDSAVFGGFGFVELMLSGATNCKSMGTGKILVKPVMVSNSFRGVFKNMSNAGVTSIPAGIFDNCTEATDFSSTFAGCNKLTSIPSNLFKYNTKVNTSYSSFNGFTSTFQLCTSITSIPAGLFDTNTLVSTGAFSTTFQATAITSVPTDLFRYNTSALSFFRVFYNCTVLETVPNGLFKYNTTDATSFAYAFLNCNNLTINPWTFYANGESATRFHDKTVNFQGLYSRGTWSGPQFGTAPDLWNCDYGTGTVTKLLCFDGAGNSTSSLSNYNSIPSTWIVP